MHEWRCFCSKALKIHGRVAHMEGGEEALPYVCIICQKRFVKKSYLEVCPMPCSDIQLQSCCRHLRLFIGAPEPISQHGEAVRLHVLPQAVLHQAGPRPTFSLSHRTGSLSMFILSEVGPQGPMTIQCIFKQFHFTF